MASTLDQVVEAVTEIRDQIRSDHRPGNSSTSGVHFHGTAPGWMLASAIAAILCLGLMAVMVALLLGMSQRISDLQSRIDSDQVKLEIYKVRNEERAAVDRLLINTVKERVTKLETQ